jgi:hypothetical protein
MRWTRPIRLRLPPIDGDRGLLQTQPRELGRLEEERLDLVTGASASAKGIVPALARAGPTSADFPKFPS